ncbi:lipocalin-like domain-containing protein [Defluviimonas sp. WL0050]|uniref:Lipocalin-like domain-containing protein n=2 Tax=Albidovulum litorale TaxID=2984134 RepID=A0ABT2ZRY3_9RHOB|nr:lipocalin-like domain-containing protein [Defluviimonas sp. WL0050]
MPSPIGTWTLNSFYLTDTVTGEKHMPFGREPIGCIVIQPSGRMIALLTPSGRKAPTTVEDKAAAFDAMVAYSGQYRIEGQEFVTSVEMAWFEPWVGGEQRRRYRLDGDTMNIESAPAKMPGLENPVVGTLVWTRES